MEYTCSICGFTYSEDDGDEDSGIEPGTAWEDVPDDYMCPTCGAGKDAFEKV